jgi:hypothetical protein
MNDIASLTGQPRPLKVRVAGEPRTYEVYPLTLDDLGRLQAWVDAQFPDPFAAVQAAIDRGNYTVPQQHFLLRTAAELATSRRRLIGTAEADALLVSIDGVKEILKLAIRKGRPEFSDDEARELFLHMGMADLEALFGATGVEMVLHDPKGGPTTSGATGSSTSRPRRRRA